MEELRDAGPTLDEQTEQRLRLRVVHLERALENQTENAQTWRRMYDEAIRRVAIFHPRLAEITEEDAFRHWETDVR